MAKKVLIISYYFNQKEQIGSIRLRGLAKYLPQFGWEPTILTIKSPESSDMEFRTIETDYSDLMTVWKKRLGLNLDKSVQDQLGTSSNKNQNGIISSLVHMWMEIFAYPDPYKNWYKPAVEAGNKLLENEDFDLVLSSSSPVTSHLIGNELSNKYGIPWVADLRDLWSQNHFYEYSNLRKYRETRLEKKTFSTVDAMVTVSAPKTEQLAMLHTTKRTYAIPNGFDPDTLNTGKQVDNKLTIVYTGRVYEGKMDPEPLFNALSELIKDKEIDPKDIVMDFYGINVDVLADRVEKYNLSQIINLKGLIPREQVIDKQRQAQILLLLNWNDPNEKGVYTGKVFEYLSAKRPILAVGGYGDGVVDELLQNTQAGASLNETTGIKKLIKEYYTEYKSTGQVQYNGIQEEIDRFSHIGMAEKFSKVFEDVEKDKSLT
jgi:glycosyltransferase involved in cell wall biosynthesis